MAETTRQHQVSPDELVRLLLTQRGPSPGAPPVPPPPAAPPLVPLPRWLLGIGHAAGQATRPEMQDSMMDKLSTVVLGDTARDLISQGGAAFPSVPRGSQQHIESAYRAGRDISPGAAIHGGNIIELLEALILPHGQPEGAKPDKEIDRAIRRDEIEDILNDVLMNIAGGVAGDASHIIGDESARDYLRQFTEWYYGKPSKK